MQVLMEHNWPGNVRELENVVERAVVLASAAEVPLDVLPDSLLQANGVRLHRGEGAPLPADASLFEIVNDFERRVIMERLEQSGWSQTEAAESLRVPLSTLNQKIKRLDIKIRKKSEN
jgi:DNA-binding NtrC family response regulator